MALADEPIKEIGCLVFVVRRDARRCCVVIGGIHGGFLRFGVAPVVCRAAAKSISMTRVFPQIGSRRDAVGGLISERRLHPVQPHGRLKVMLVFGTRPEFIKVLPVIKEIEKRADVSLTTVMTSQHTDLVHGLAEDWSINVDHDLAVMTQAQSLNDIVSRIVGRIDDILESDMPDVVLVQGDTSSAFAGALAAFQRRIPVGHIEAGLRTDSIVSPFPEESNRRLIGKIAQFHFAPTPKNVSALQKENVHPNSIFLTGNTVVDAVHLVLGQKPPSDRVKRLIDSLTDQRIVFLTTHRRESFGSVMKQRLQVIREFVESRPDVSLVFPVHPNPEVRDIAQKIMAGVERIHLLDPLAYHDCLHCLDAAWVILSDSGGIQEEAPSLGKPLLILRDETERPEAIECGVARLVGQSADKLKAELDELDRPGSWASKVASVDNPFGLGDSAERIVDILVNWNARQSAATRSELVP